jgi:hypothetical protein
MESVIGIKWSSRAGRLDMAIQQFSLNFKVKSQWQLQRKAIEKFKLECQDDEKLVLEQALLLCYDQCRKHWIIYLHASSLLSSFSSFVNQHFYTYTKDVSFYFSLLS